MLIFPGAGGSGRRPLQGLSAPVSHETGAEKAPSRGGAAGER